MLERLKRNATGIRGVLVVYWCLMFLGTHAPKVPDPLEKVSDKTLHFLAYCGLYLLLVIDAATRRRVTWRLLGAYALLCAVYGIADELLQIPVGRSADVRDWFADMRGVAAGAGVVAVARWLYARTISRTQSQSTEK